MTAGYREGAPVFTDLSLDLPGGGLIHVRGRNGSGKSTLLELFSGYLRPWTGTVSVGGLDASGPQARRIRRVCRTAPALYPHMTVRDHLRFAARATGSDAEAAADRAKLHGLEPWLDYDARSLSTGNARKLWYVICTLGDFVAVFLDEPFNALDMDGITRVCEEIEKWAADRTVLLTSHRLADELQPHDAIDLDQVTTHAGGDASGDD